MKKIAFILTTFTLSPCPIAFAQAVVAAPGVEVRQDQKNIFDVLKYTWEQAKWTEKLATLQDTLTTARQNLETANKVKQAIGDPAAAIALIDNGLFSGYLEQSNLADTLGELADIAREGGKMSSAISQLFKPINLKSWHYLAADTAGSFEGIASFRDRDDPLKRFRAVENAYSRLEILLGRAQNKRKVINRQIAKLNDQLKGAKNDAEVQKLVGSLAAAQAVLDDIDYLSESAASQVQMIQILNQNRTQQEEVAAEEISRERNRELAKKAAQAEAKIELDFSAPIEDLPLGF